MTPEMFTQILAAFEGLPQQWKGVGIAIACLAALSSLLSSILNPIVREKTAAGVKVSPVLLVFLSVLNFISMNVDKGLQMVKLVRGLPVTNTGVVVSAVPGPQIITITEEEEKQIVAGTHPTIKRVLPEPTPPVS